MRPLTIPGPNGGSGELFDSIAEFMSVTNARTPNAQGRAHNSAHTNGHSFTNTDSYEQAESLLRDGWEEPLAQLRADFSALTVKPVESRTRAKHCNHIIGHTPNVPRALQGLPDSMRRIDREPMKVKTLTLLYDVSALGGTETARFTKAGAVVLAAVATLERLGFRVRLYVVSATVFGNRSGGTDQGAVCGILLKNYRDPLDLKKLCYPLAHASMLRRHFFRWRETTPTLTRTDSGYGSSYNSNSEYHARAREHFAASHEYYFSLRDVENTQHNVAALLDRLGITAATAK